jgi:glyoxalase/bleomycin resistance protein/dioxygenase superfamily protein
MLTRVDRVQMIVADRKRAATSFFRLLGAELAREDRLRAVDAVRTVLRLGTSEVELLEPDGSGIAADCLRATGGGLFAAGVATQDLAGVRARLRTQGVEFVEEGQQLFVPQAGPGLRVVVSAEPTGAPVGLARRLYEVTNLVANAAAATAHVAAAFGLDDRHFVPIQSAEFGYAGVLTLFHPEHLDRFEVITPTDPSKTMGRFFAKRGASLYMCYIEADDLREIRTRLLEHAPEDWTGPRSTDRLDNLFIHPRALAGMMMGVSRTTHAWTWSGHPERVIAEGQP